MRMITLADARQVEAEYLAQRLEDTQMYRILRRFVPPDVYAEPDSWESNPATATIVDLETTGLEDDARIIEMSLVRFSFDLKTCRVHRVLDRYSSLEDPGIPIPAEITELTGIRNEDVAGQKIDDTRVQELVAPSGLVIAWHAEFDRPLSERRCPVFVDKHWACAMKEVHWDSFGARGKKQLDYMLERILGQFYDGHRATEDCEVVLHLLATPTATIAGTYQREGEDPLTLDVPVTPFQLLLGSAQTRWVRVWALDSSFTKKDVLKSHGYLWSPGRNGARKGWWIDVVKDRYEAERAFLEAEVYQCPSPKIFISKITGKDRYSIRA